MILTIDKSKMVTVEIIGGLGNQMFQFAFCHSLKKHYGENNVSVYLERYNNVKDNDGYLLKKIFNIEVTTSHIHNVKGLIDDSRHIISRIRYKLLGRKDSFFLEQLFKFDKNVFRKNIGANIYYRGLWQDELYFNEYRNELCKIFNFPSKLDKLNQSTLLKIRETNSVSIHVRRGDYINNEKYNNILGNICTYKYYKNAFEFLLKKETNLTFFVFSDDIKWVESEFDFLKQKSIIFVNNNFGINSYIDMQLMSNCKNNIIANSSFSWWGAWLNKNPKKIVIAPEKWFKNNARLENNHIVPDSWIKMNIE
jgi:hypothetical protein